MARLANIISNFVSNKAYFLPNCAVLPKMNTKRHKAVILNDLLHLNVSFIRKAFDLKRVGKQRRELILHNLNPITGEREIQASISATLILDNEGNDYADLNFIIKGKPVKQRIELIFKQSSLMKGHVFYFKCLLTGKQRRKLFLYNGQFVSRQAIPHAYYEIETQSRKQRAGVRGMKRIVRLQAVVKEAGKKRIQKYYNGEPTKRYLNVLIAGDTLNDSW